MPEEKVLYKRVIAVPIEKLMIIPIKDLEQTVKLLEIEAKENVSVMLWIKAVIEVRLRTQ